MKALARIILALLIISSCSNDAKEDDDPTLPSVVDDLDGPINKPTEGYGSDGTYAVAKIAFESPTYEEKM